MAADVRPVQRFGLFVGANEGEPSLPRLRWAVADAEKMASIMVEAGGIEKRNATVLGQPSGPDLMKAIQTMGDSVRATRTAGRKAEFYFYYSGHSDERGLLLGGQRVLYTDLRRAITGTEADVNVAILDSCDSGAFTRSKGGERVQPFLTDLSSETTGYAFLTSSSATEASQESDQLGGSFFTYYFINGLRGAADTDGNQRVTLNQAYQYAFRETLAQTEETSAGAQHPSYDFQLKGSGDLVIVDLTNHRGSVLLDRTLNGRFYVRDQKGTLVSELQKEAGNSLTIALPSGTYTIRYRRDGLVHTARITVTDENPAVVTVEQFASEPAPVNRTRGEDGVRRLNPFDIEFIPQFGPLPDEDTAFSLGILGARVDTVRGFQAGSIVTLTGVLDGGQAAGVIAMAGPVTGAQFAGVAAIAGDLTDIQSAGVLSVARGVNGVQTAGVLSVAQDVVGVQSSGVLNVARSVDGVQAGVVNVATKVHGVQVGVFNYADTAEGVPVGVVSWIGNGIHEIDTGYDTAGNGAFVRWTGGSRVFWTSLELGLQSQTSSLPGNNPAVHGLWFDMGVGLRWQLDRLAFDWGVGARQLSSIETDQIKTLGTVWGHQNSLALVPHTGVLVRYSLMDRLAVWAGPHIDWVDSRLVSFDRYETGGALPVFVFSPRADALYLGFSAGLSFKL
jgi:hypothetical protein